MKYKKLFQQLAQISVAAGEEIMKIYSGEIEVEFKDDNSPLTAADCASHNVIVNSLSGVEFDGRTLPVISEEGDIPSYDVRKDWDLFWLIDPLDGTKEFVKKRDEFTVNIALIKNNHPYIGVVYLPVKKVLYLGGMETGSFKSDASDTSLSAAEKLPRDIKRDPDVLMAAGSRSHRTEEFDGWVNLQAERRGCSRVEVLTAGSSLKFCIAAEGLVDVYPRFWSHHGMGFCRCTCGC